MDLKPCPLCGQEPIMSYRETAHDGIVKILCSECKLEKSEIGSRRVEQKALESIAVYGWNKRIQNG